MQNRQNGRRRRGSGNNNPRPMGQPMGGQSANRLEVRVRGNAHQLHEKYKVMARDAHQAGDRVAAEFYLQHADHYFRVLNDARIRQEEMRARRSGFDRYEEDVDIADDGGSTSEADSTDAAAPEDGETAMRPLAEDRDSGSPRTDRGNRTERSTERSERSGERRDNRRRERRPQFDEQGGFAPISDGEAALAAFGGPVRDPAPLAEPVAESLPPVILELGRDPVESPLPATAEAEPAKPVRRRGRPRKVEVSPSES